MNRARKLLDEEEKMSKVKKYLSILLCWSNKKVPLDRLGVIGFMIGELYSAEVRRKITQFSPRWRWVARVWIVLLEKAKIYNKVSLVAEKLASKTEFDCSAIYYHYGVREVRRTLLPRIFRYCRYADGEYPKGGSRAERWLSLLSV